MPADSLHPTFSIITVTYNAEATLERTIRSVEAQTYDGVEYIIVDGRSVDGTAEIVARHRPAIDVLVCEPDKGLYDAMNKGMKLATGDYVCFMNAGDTFHDADTLRRVAACVAVNTLPDIVYGETCIVNMDGQYLGMRRHAAPEVLDWRSFRQGMMVCHQSFYVLRRLAVAEPYNLRYRFSADFDWCIRVMKRSTRIVNVNQILTNYLSEGMTTKNRKASLCERFRIMSRHYGLVSTLACHAWFVVRLLWR